ncbi:hypothetical protein KI743_22235 [Vibrio sp. D420a]|uniref:hypothetical protein n=1 Tax=Vibrio sp. D420a TaxID=2836895 RepID=UPI002556F8DE|nr:hypothetical protein [Vibrio sp. D420a]MDK9764726.1 hypothetical protein [Vibrio sp. D420a]
MNWFQDGALFCSPDECFQFWDALNLHAARQDLPIAINQNFCLENVGAPLAGAVYQSNGIEALEYLRCVYPIATPFEIKVMHGRELTCITLIESQVLIQKDASLRCLLNHYYQLLLVQLLRCASRNQIGIELMTTPFSDRADKAFEKGLGTITVLTSDASRIVIESEQLYPQLLTYNQQYINAYQAMLESLQAQLAKHNVEVR